MLSKEEITALLAPIPDPEIPVITIQDLGILRNVEVVGNKVIVQITPTYNGCPAMNVIEKEIIQTLHENGVKDVEVKLVYTPAWTTDWLSADAKERLREYGIAPPEAGSGDYKRLKGESIRCPRCGSTETTLVSSFGSTACKALYKCKSCLEPFDHFKCH